MDKAEWEIMAEVAKGELPAFREIVEQYQKPLLNYIYRYAGERAASEDIAQEVFLRVFKTAKESRPLSSFKTWLFKIATKETEGRELSALLMKALRSLPEGR